MTPEERLERYARLAVEVGSNVGEGQVVWLIAPARACAARARNRPGRVRARRQLRRLSTTPTSTSGARGSSTPTRTASTGRRRGRSSRSTTSRRARRPDPIAGDPEPELLADLDGRLVGKTRMRDLAERYLDGDQQAADQLDDRRLSERRLGEARSSASRTSSASGTPSLYGDAAGRARPGRGLAMRTSTSWPRAPPDSASARFDAVRFRGPGTDLTVGLIHGGAWSPAAARPSRAAASSRTCRPRRSSPAPDRRRTEGVVRSTMPLALSGNIVRDLALRFEGGRRSRSKPAPEPS